MEHHDTLRSILTEDHQGASNSASGAELAARLGCKTRKLRAYVLRLRELGVAVCGSPQGGYYIAKTPEEIEGTARLLESHAMHQLQVAASLRNKTLPELLGQLSMNV